MGSQYSLQRALPSIPRFTVGQDHHGWWVVHDRLNRIGGLFSNEMAALHFANEESDRDAWAVCRAPAGKCIELEGVTIRAQGMEPSPRRSA